MKAHPMRISRGVLALSALAAFGWSVAAGKADSIAPASVPSLGTLDYAFRFATAITSDAKDRAKAQELALAEYTQAGAYDEVARRAPEIDGWRRGVVYADLAASLARAGWADEARDFVRKAEAVREGVSGWENPRISAHVAEALVLLGDTAQANTIAASLAANDPIQYAGRAAATQAVGESIQGNFAAAMTRLRDLESNDDLDVAWSRTMGYLALARQSSAPKSSRLEALDAARASADRLIPQRRLDALLQIAPEYAALGRKGDGRKAVVAAAQQIETPGPANAEMIPGLVAVGQAWGETGEPQRGRVALQQAETLVPQALSIDQPGLVARIASAYRKLPDAERARQLDLKALDSAAAMRLARPRALSLAAICRQMGRDGVLLDASMRSRLDGLLNGLGEPW